VRHFISCFWTYRLGSHSLAGRATHLSYRYLRNTWLGSDRPLFDKLSLGDCSRTAPGRAAATTGSQHEQYHGVSLGRAFGFPANFHPAWNKQGIPGFTCRLVGHSEDMSMLGLLSLRLVLVPRLNTPRCKHTITETIKITQKQIWILTRALACGSWFLSTDCMIFLGEVWRRLMVVDLWGCTRGEVMASGWRAQQEGRVLWLCGRCAPYA